MKENPSKTHHVTLPSRKRTRAAVHNTLRNSTAAREYIVPPRHLEIGRDEVPLVKFHLALRPVANHSWAGGLSLISSTSFRSSIDKASLRRSKSFVFASAVNCMRISLASSSRIRASCCPGIAFHSFDHSHPHSTGWMGQFPLTKSHLVLAKACMGSLLVKDFNSWDAILDDFKDWQANDKDMDDNSDGDDNSDDDVSSDGADYAKGGFNDDDIDDRGTNPYLEGAHPSDWDTLRYFSHYTFLLHALTAWNFHFRKSNYRDGETSLVGPAVHLCKVNGTPRSQAILVMLGLEDLLTRSQISAPKKELIMAVCLGIKSPSATRNWILPSFPDEALYLQSWFKIFKMLLKLPNQTGTAISEIEGEIEDRLALVEDLISKPRCPSETLVLFKEQRLALVNYMLFYRRERYGREFETFKGPS
ncbi:hypothetical protein B0H66DRAFT_535417 [Apodospora peruviana]|uniref:Uncharacterized protein n=1 Tax=Apodospora peruviana TaxID=516989 RepID=A0AAE0HXT0_9PEZI|nr:hypothetical protein B0H66DRAFT_535417 [Apodospora peruviana]